MKSVLSLGLILFILAACGAPALPTAGAEPQATEPTVAAGPQATEPPTAPPAPTAGAVGPPPAVLEVGGQQQTSGIGTYCWSSVGAGGQGAGMCVDMIGTITPAEPLPVQSPFSARLRLPLPDAPTEMTLRAMPVQPENSLDVPGGKAWQWTGNEGSPPAIALSQPAFDLALEPGLYVLDLFVRWDQPNAGDVSYGFLVEVAGDSESPTPIPSAEAGGEQALLVYVWDGDVWLKRLPDGAQTQLTQLGDVRHLPRLSPDGKYVLFARPGGRVTVPEPEQVEVEPAAWWIAPVAGGEPRQLLDPLADLPGKSFALGDDSVTYPTEPGPLAWLPDGRRLLFTTQVVMIEAAPGLYDLWQLDVETGQVDALLPAGQGGRPLVSPDGEWVLLNTPTEIAVARSDGSERRTLLTFNAVPTYSEWAWVPQPVWNADGTVHVAVARPYEVADPVVYDLWRLDPATGDQTALGRLSTTMLGLRPPVWSPDRERLAYPAPGENGQLAGALLVGNGDGTNARVAALGDVGPIAWSPDGRYLVYGQAGLLCTVEDREGAQPACPASGFDVQVHWLDAERLVFMAGGPDDQVSLVLGSVSGEEIVPLWEGTAPMTYDLYLPAGSLAP